MGRVLVRVAPNMDVVRNGSVNAGINKSSTAAAHANVASRLLAAQCANTDRHRQQLILWLGVRSPHTCTKPQFGHSIETRVDGSTKSSSPTYRPGEANDTSFTGGGIGSISKDVPKAVSFADGNQ
jgi:hypothetical protein